MKQKGRKRLLIGVAFLGAFAALTYLLHITDVKPFGVNGTSIGFSTVNCFVHKLCGVNMALYTVTDWAGILPIVVAFAFAIMGLIQLIKRKNLFKVDADILILGVYYIAVASLYLIFETVIINYRPILINGFMEASYPSSTTLLVLGVMPTLAEQISRRCKNSIIRNTVRIVTFIFSAFMVVGRLFSGVHWFTDILGSVLLCAGLFNIYKGVVMIAHKDI